MPPASLYIITYDVTCDRERDRVSEVLEGFGVRAQFSVFECRLTRGMRARLVRSLETLAVQSGTIHIYPARATSRPVYLGPPPQGADFTERSGESAWIV
jgi:CRISPR-associated protein Cas2